MMHPLKYGVGIGFAIIMGLVLVAVIIYTIIALRKQVSTRKAEERDRAQVLRERYKRGEISKMEYQAKNKDLNG